MLNLKGKRKEKVIAKSIIELWVLGVVLMCLGELGAFKLN